MRKRMERLVLRSIHPTAGSKYTVVLGPPLEPPIWVPARRHHDLPMTPVKRKRKVKREAEE